MVFNLKECNSAKTLWDKVDCALASTEVKEIDGTDLKDFLKEVIEMRKKGRYQVCCRSAALIIHKKSGEAITKLNAECKSLKVVLPKVINALLAKIQRPEESGDEM